MLRLVVLASGRGSNLQALIEAAATGRIDACVVAVFSDRASCAAMALAKAHAIPARALRPADHATREDFDEAMFSEIAAIQPDLIVFAGYMRLVSARAVRRFPGRMINIHPSLLPRYPGLHTHARALAAGDAVHGASVHCVIPELDAGPVIAQARVPVLPGDDVDSLAQRVLRREHPLLVQCVKAIADGRLALSESHVQWHGNLLHAPLSLNDKDELEETQ